MHSLVVSWLFWTALSTSIIRDIPFKKVEGKAHNLSWVYLFVAAKGGGGIPLANYPKPQAPDTSSPFVWLLIIFDLQYYAMKMEFLWVTK